MAARASFGLLWLCGVSLRLTVLSVPPVISLIQHDLDLSGTEIGLLSGMPVVVFAIFAAPGSIVVARMGVRGALVCGLLLAAAGTLLRIGAASAWQLYLTTMLMSIGIAIMQPSMAAAVREWAPERSAFGTAVYTNGLIMGEIFPVATMLPFVLPYFSENWRPALGVWAVPLIAAAATVAIFAPKSFANTAANSAGKVSAGWLPKWNSRLNWRIGLTLGSITSAYFCLNGFLPARLNAIGHQELVSAALTGLNAGQVPASFLLLLTADKLQGKRWPYMVLGALTSACVVGILTTASAWTIFWTSLAGFSLGAGLTLGLALPPLLCSTPNDVAPTSAAAFAIAYGFAMLVSFVSGVTWDLAGNINAVLIPILLGSLPIFVMLPKLVRSEKAVAAA
ncbi:MAG: MFS transporter [Bradyrhizobium sp.]|nr:MFS transporter [Bradyrhizobium sp.]